MKHRAQDSDCFHNCQPGCECKPGYFLDKGKCVPEAECPCYDNRVAYKNGDVIKRRCNKCVCQAGSWECSKQACLATCSLVGHSQVTTFDGKTYRHRGSCEYALVEVCPSTYATYQTSLSYHPFCSQ